MVKQKSTEWNITSFSWTEEIHFFILSPQRLLKYFKYQIKVYCKLFTLCVHTLIIGLGFVVSLLCGWFFFKAQRKKSEYSSQACF